MSALGWAILTMAIVIVTIDQLFWRPLVAWSDRFRVDQTTAAAAPQSWVYDLLRASRLQRRIRAALRPAFDVADSMLERLTATRAAPAYGRENPTGEVIFTVSLVPAWPRCSRSPCTSS